MIVEYRCPRRIVRTPSTCIEFNAVQLGRRRGGLESDAGLGGLSVLVWFLSGEGVAVSSFVDARVGAVSAGWVEAGCEVMGSDAVVVFQA